VPLFMSHPQIISNAINSVRKFATGGYVTKPTLGLVGEAGPEVILPMQKYLALTETPIKNLGIPMLASGGIVDKPLLALIGEGPEPEAVIPLSELERMRGEEARTQQGVQVVVVQQRSEKEDQEKDEGAADMRETVAQLKEQNARLQAVIQLLVAQVEATEQQTGVIVKTSGEQVSTINKLNSNGRSR